MVITALMWQQARHYLKCNECYFSKPFGQPQPRPQRDWASFAFSWSEWLSYLTDRKHGSCCWLPAAQIERCLLNTVRKKKHESSSQINMPGLSFACRRTLMNKTRSQLMIHHALQCMCYCNFVFIYALVEEEIGCHCWTSTLGNFLYTKFFFFCPN